MRFIVEAKLLLIQNLFLFKRRKMILTEYEDSSEEGVGTSTLATVCPTVELTTVSDASCGAPSIVLEISGKAKDTWWKGLDYQAWIMLAAIYILYGFIFVFEGY